MDKKKSPKESKKESTKESAKEVANGSAKKSAHGSAHAGLKKDSVKNAAPASRRSSSTPAPPPSAKSDQPFASSEEVSAFFSGAQIVAQYLKDLSFESPNAPQIFSHGQGTTPNFSLDINVKPQRLAALRHEVVLALKVSMQRDGEVCFLVEIVYAGLIAVLEGADEHPLLQPLLLIEVPRLLFPYARNILSELTQSSGFPPLVVQPVDFAALYRKHLSEAAGTRQDP